MRNKFYMNEFQYNKSSLLKRGNPYEHSITNND